MPRLYLVHVAAPSRETHHAWMCEAAGLGFTRKQAWYLCYWRWWARVDPTLVKWRERNAADGC